MTRVFCLFNAGHRVKRLRTFGLFDATNLFLWFAWRCSNRTGIALAHSEAPRKPSGFLDHISMTFCPCIVIGFLRVSGAANFRIEFSNESQTLEEIFFIPVDLITACLSDGRGNPAELLLRRDRPTIRANLFANAATAQHR